MKELVLVCDGREALTEWRELVPEIPVIGRSAPWVAGTDIFTAARELTRETFLSVGKPVLTLLADVYFDTPSSPYTPVCCQTEDEIASFAKPRLGWAGVMRIVSAFTEDGADVEVEPREVPGTLVFPARGKLGSVLDRIWVPNGYQSTVAELIGYQPRLNRRERVYRTVGARLGARTARDVYEAHITVEMPAGHTFDSFRRACQAVGVKAIHIELDAGVRPTHFITGSVHSGRLSQVEQELDMLERRLREMGLRPVRRKVEAMIQNPLVPVSSQDVVGRPASNYFEFHTKVTLEEGQELESLRQLCRSSGVHIARSASNKLSSGRRQKFVTARFHAQGRLEAEAQFANFLEGLRALGFQSSHVLKEYVVIDTNLGLDAGWADSVAA